MKRFILSLFILATIVSPSALCRGDTIVIIQAPAANGCDSCAGTLALAIHFEDTVGSDLTQETPCGCTDGTDTTYAMTDGASHSDTQASDGTYSADCRGTSDRVLLGSTNLTFAAVGTYFVDYYKSDDGSGRIFTFATGFSGTMSDGGATNTINLNYQARSVGGTDTFADGSFVRLGFAWDSDNEKLAVKVGANAWQEDDEAAFAAHTLDADIRVTSDEWQEGRGYFDNIKIYTDYRHTE